MADEIPTAGPRPDPETPPGSVPGTSKRKTTRLDDRYRAGGKTPLIFLVLLIAALSFGAGWLISRAVPGERQFVSTERGGAAAGAAAGGTGPGLTGPVSPAAGAEASAGDIMREMHRIQREMDRTFTESIGRFEGTPAFDRMLSENFNQAMNVRDEKSRYVVEVNLPEQDVDDVDVKLDGQLLRVGMTTQEAKRQKLPGGQAQSQLVSSFAQTISLPGPVKSEEMKVEREKGRLVITVPKG